MAHYAKVLNGNVIDVIVAEEDFFDTFIDSSPGNWIKTSYNTYGDVHYNAGTWEPSEDQSKALRYNFASIGGTYDEEADAFIPPKSPELNSWVLNKSTYRWEPPVPKPDYSCYWDEETVSWKKYEE